MNETDTVEKKPIVLPCIAGLFCVLSFFLIGLAAPVFTEMFRGFRLDPLPPHLRVISRLHWFWTLPLGCVVAAGLIWGSRRWSRKTNLVVDLVSIVSAVLMFFAFAFAAFLPIFGTLPISSPVLGNKVMQIDQFVMADDVAALRQAVSNDPSLLNVQNSLGWTPLHFAAAKDHLMVVRFLLEQGAVVDIRNHEGKTALNMMMSYLNNNRRDIAQLLLDYGADPNSTDNEGNTPAFGTVSTEVLDLLKDYGADLQITNRHGYTAFDHAALYNDGPKLAVLQALGLQGSSNIFTACGRNEISTVQDLLKGNPGLVKATNHNRDTPLHIAAGNGHPTCVNLLIECGADVDARNANGWTPLIMAVGNRHIECVKILLDHDANISIKDNRGQTPLIWSIYDNTCQALRLLLAHGASIQDKNENEETPLHKAVSEGNPEATRLLIAAGADPNALSQRGTPLDVLLSPIGGSRDVQTHDILVKAGGKTTCATVLKTCPNRHQTLTNVPVVAGFAVGAEGRNNVDNFKSWPGGCTRPCHSGEIVVRCTTCRYTFDPLLREWFIPSPDNEFDRTNRKKIFK